MLKSILHFRTPLIPRPPTQACRFTTSTNTSKTRIYDPIRNEADFHTALRATTTAGIPLVTMWTASYCPSCNTVKPVLKDILETRDCSNGGVGFAEVELDAPGGGMGELGYRYSIRALPTLLVFIRGEVAEERRLVDVRAMADRERMKVWVEGVAGEGVRGGGKSWMGGLFGG